ncbi:MAG: PAS domain S-box protein [Halorubrum sp.]|uniref:PAS domain S-box protein n=1 Tax=Halorubrum sp. TaxID=1879286 RepID=UPI003970D2A1
MAGPTGLDGKHWLPREELFVPIDSERVLSAGWSDDGATASDASAVRDVLERAGVALAAALDRINSRSDSARSSETASGIRLGAFRQAIEDAADGIAVLDDEAFVYVDQTHADMYGFDGKQQLLGRSWRELYAADEAARIEGDAFDALERDGRWQGRVTGNRPDGTTFPAELSLTMVGPSRMVCTVRDVTDRERRERELSLKERALDEAGASIQITDPTRPGNPLVYVNEEFVRLTGYDRSDALGRNPRFLQGPGSDPETTNRIRTAIDTERPITTEVRNYTADGEPYWAKLSVMPVRDANGIVTNYIGVQHDITEQRRLIRELTDRTNRLELVLGGTGTGIGEWDFTTNTVTLDATLREIVGTSPTTMDEWQAIVHPADRERSTDALRRPIETGEPTAETVRVRTEDGEVTWIDIHAVASDAGDGPARVLAMGRDATDRSERVRWASRLFDRGPLLFVQTRAVDGEAVVEACDRSFSAALGYEREAVVGQPLTRFYTDDSTDSLRSDGYERALSGELTVAERTLVTTDGDTVPCLLRAIPRTVDGAVVGTDVLFVDISEREKYVRRLEAMFNSPYQFTALIRPDGTVTDVNDALIARIGVDRSAMVGERIDEFPWLSLDADRGLTVGEAVGRAADGTFVESEAELQGRDGLARIEVSFRPIRNADEDIALIAVEGNDVTVRTQQRQHLQVLQRVVRHNFRNDLNKLVGWTTILAEESDADRRQDHLRRLTRIFDSWERITEKMRVIDRAIREIPRDESTVDVREVTETAVTAAHGDHPDATTAVSIDAPDWAVSRWLEQPLTEVMKNAVLAGDRADPHVDVSVERAGEGWLRIVVADDGPGMPDVERAVLATGEETPLRHGSGLGVWLIRMLVSTLGGEVDVDVTDAGTEITLLVPAAADSDRFGRRPTSAGDDGGRRLRSRDGASKL